MCYTGECVHEQQTGPDTGECRRPGDAECPCIGMSSKPNTALECELRNKELIKAWNANVDKKYVMAAGAKKWD